MTSTEHNERNEIFSFLHYGRVNCIPIDLLSYLTLTWPYDASTTIISNVSVKKFSTKDFSILPLSKYIK
jgi:hypothetical protein